MKHVVILGAGKSGRGFIARLLYKEAAITFIDSDQDLVKRLNEEKGFSVRYFDGSPAEYITGFTALHTDDPACIAALQNCDAVFSSVRGENCSNAALWLKDKLPDGTCLVACENAVLPATLMGELENRTCSAAVFCTTMATGTLDIFSENYPSLHVDAPKASAVVLGFPGIKGETDFSLLMLRKIYTYNASSGIIAYLGAQKQIESYAEAALNTEIAKELDHFYHEINTALSLEYGIPAQDQQQFADNARKKFESREIEDSVARNAASPERKLNANERLIAPARLIQKHGGDPAPLCKAAAAALHYIPSVKTAEQAGAVLREISRLKNDETLYQQILSYF